LSFGNETTADKTHNPCRECFKWKSYSSHWVTRHFKM